MSPNVTELVRARSSEISARTRPCPPQRTSSGWLRLQPAPGMRGWGAGLASRARQAAPLGRVVRPPGQEGAAAGLEDPPRDPIPFTRLVAERAAYTRDGGCFGARG